MRKLEKTPPAAVEGGRAHFGAFESEFRRLNLLDADPFGLGGLSPRALRDLRLKEWQHFAVVTPHHFLGLAVVNAKFLGVSWCYAFDRRTREMAAHTRQLPLRGPAVSRELWNDRFGFRARSYEVTVENRLDDGRHVVTFNATGRDSPPVRGRLEIRERPDEIQPLILLAPLGRHGIFYTHKVPCPVGGEITVGGESHALDPARDFAILDIHKAYYPYRTWWKWATFAGRDAKGKLLAGNLFHGLVADGENENCLWHDGRLSLLAGARFDVPEDILAPWRITTIDGRVDLVFRPEGMREETVDFKVVVSWYRAPLGTFSGTMRDDDGVVHEVRDLFGIAEHHRVTW